MSYFTVQGTREILYHKRIMMPKWIIVHQTSLLLKSVTTVYHRDSLIYGLVNDEGHFLEYVKLNGHPGVLSKAESCSPVVVCYFYYQQPVTLMCTHLLNTSIVLHWASWDIKFLQKWGHTMCVLLSPAF